MQSKVNSKGGTTRRNLFPAWQTMKCGINIMLAGKAEVDKLIANVCHCSYTYEFLQLIQPCRLAEMKHNNLPRNLC